MPCRSGRQVVAHRHSGSPGRSELTLGSPTKVYFEVLEEIGQSYGFGQEVLFHVSLDRNRQVWSRFRFLEAAGKQRDWLPNAKFTRAIGFRDNHILTGV